MASQLRTAPEDASFLYETRYIPEYGSSEEFLPPDLEQEVIVETLERQTNRGFQIQLPITCFFDLIFLSMFFSNQ